MATVPNVVGVSFLTALGAIAGAGLLTTLQQSYAPAVGIGNIVSQNPAALATAAAGTSVIIVMSAGVSPQAGNGYDKWGATGGGIDAVNAPEPAGQALSYAQQPDNAVYAANQSVLAALAVGRINLNTPAYQVPIAPTMGTFGFTDSDIDFPYVYFWGQSLVQQPNVWNYPPVAFMNQFNTAVDWI
jgi:PASTA domain